jgi:hypothetical protein
LLIRKLTSLILKADTFGVSEQQVV